MLKIFISIYFLFSATVSFATEWGVHRQNIRNIETQILQLEAELKDKVDRKKSTKDRAMIEESLQRIVEIHAELISLRKDLSNEISHVKMDHPKEASSLNIQESKKMLSDAKKKFSMNPLNIKLDDLIRKIQSKFASFIQEAEETEEVLEIDEVIKQKKLQRKEKESQIYLRKKSKVRLVK